MINDGVAWLHSDEDERWNVNVECKVGGFAMPSPLEEKFEELKEEIEEEPPDDLEWHYMKE